MLDNYFDMSNNEIIHRVTTFKVTSDEASIVSMSLVCGTVVFVCERSPSCTWFKMCVLAKSNKGTTESGWGGGRLGAVLRATPLWKCRRPIFFAKHMRLYLDQVCIVSVSPYHKVIHMSEVFKRIYNSSGPRSWLYDIFNNRKRRENLWSIIIIKSRAISALSLRQVSRRKIRGRWQRWCT